MVGPKIIYEALKQRVDEEAEDQKEGVLPVVSLKTMIESRRK